MYNIKREDRDENGIITWESDDIVAYLNKIVKTAKIKGRGWSYIISFSDDGMTAYAKLITKSDD